MIFILQIIEIVFQSHQRLKINTILQQSFDIFRFRHCDRTLFIVLYVIDHPVLRFRDVRTYHTVVDKKINNE